MFKERFSFVYGVFAAIVVLSWVATGYMLTHPYKLPPTVAHKADVAAGVKEAVRQASGDQNLAAQCEASITATINQNYGKVTAPFKLVSSVPNKDGVHQDVTVSVSSSLYNGKLVCSFHKTDWTLQGVAPPK